MVRGGRVEQWMTVLKIMTWDVAEVLYIGRSYRQVGEGAFTTLSGVAYFRSSP